MKKQLLEEIGARFKSATATTAALAIALCSAGTARAGNDNANPASPSSTQNVNVVNTPTVTVGNTPTVNVGNTPTVNATVTFPANQNVTVNGAGPLTNVGRLASQQVMLLSAGPGECPSRQFVADLFGAVSCFDMASHPGQVLVITDIYWSATGSPGTTCGVGLVPSSAMAFGPFLVSATPAATDGTASKTEHLTTGAKMAVNPTLSTTAYGIPATCTFLASVMQGYLVPNQ